MTAVVRELRAGRTQSGEVTHAAWVTDTSDAVAWVPPGPPLSLCGRYHVTALEPGLIRWSAPSCWWCIVALNDAIRRDTRAVEVMKTGEPGGHPDQHDDDCDLACSCGPDPDPPWCRRHEGMWLDPEARQTLRAGGCDRLPGCGWPSAGGGPP